MKTIKAKLTYFGNDGKEIPKTVFQKAVDEYLKQDNKFGIVRTSSNRDLYTNVGNISHLVKTVDFEGDDVYVTVDLLDTASGKILQEIVDKNIEPRFAPILVGEYDGEEEGDLKYKSLSILSIDCL